MQCTVTSAGDSCTTKIPSNHGWCFTCGKVVDITDSGVSFWNLMAVFTMLWAVQV